MKAGHAQQQKDVEMLDITGAGAQPPMRPHWKLRPGPQSHKNSKQQCKRSEREGPREYFENAAVHARLIALEYAQSKGSEQTDYA